MLLAEQIPASFVLVFPQMFTHQHWNLRHNDQNLKQLDLILHRVCKNTNISFSSSILLFHAAMHNILHVFMDKNLYAAI